MYRPNPTANDAVLAMCVCDYVLVIISRVQNILKYFVTCPSVINN